MAEPLKVLHVRTANICRSPALGLLTRELLSEAEVLTAESVHRQHILDDFPQLHRKVSAPGRCGTTLADLPNLTGRELVEAAGTRRTPSSPAHAADLHRRGEAAATRATGTITPMLRVVVPRLVGDR